jgi:hypothetical protein
MTTICTWRSGRFDGTISCSRRYAGNAKASIQHDSQHAVHAQAASRLQYGV